MDSGKLQIIDPKSTYIDEEAEVGEGTVIYPNTTILGQVKIAKGVHVGNYVEMVRTNVGSNTKVGHVTYLGDATVGENVNIGAGTITANYDGRKKNKTVVEDGVFIGADTTLVAPVKVGKGAKTGAGAVVIENVSENTLVVGVPAVEKKKI